MRRNSALLWRPFGRHFWRNSARHAPTRPSPAPLQCEGFDVVSELPTRSVPNWLALLTGASPAIHGIVGNVAVPPFPYDSVFKQAAAHGVHAGIAASPWMVNPVKRWLPLLDGDGRVSSSADGAYETTANGTTVKLDDARHAAALRGAHLARYGSDGGLSDDATGKYSLFVMHLTNVDSIGHRKGATVDTLPYVEAARHAKDQVETLMRDWVTPHTSHPISPIRRWRR